jgi:hypothetical protein
VGEYKIAISDHCPLVAELPMKSRQAQRTTNRLHPTPPIVIWDDTSDAKYKEALLLPEIQQSINALCSHAATGVSDLNAQVNNLSDILFTTAKKSLKFITATSRRQTHKIRKRKIPLSDTCRSLKLDLKSARKMFHKYPQDPHVRGKYFHIAKRFKREVRKRKREIKGQLIQNVEQAQNGPQGQKQFWSGVNDLIGRNKVDNTDQVPDSEWKQYFRDLSTAENPQQFSSSTVTDDVENFVRNLASRRADMGPFTPEQNELLHPFTTEEIRKQINGLKRGKGTGPDGIKNEMLRSSIDHLAQPITQIFNNILSFGAYPAAWKLSLIKPIHRKGDKSSASNYRGISLQNVLAKVFAMILNDRLYNFLEATDFFFEGQSGFIKKRQTGDNAFVLRHLIEKNFRQSKRVYTGFVDFKRAFDTVPRNTMLYKLHKAGVPQAVIRVIESMYSDNKSAVKLSAGITDTFPNTVGVKQGCPLSPLLFNVYINDLEDFLNQEGHRGISIGDKAVSCLLFADDVLLLANNASDLQYLFDRLMIYSLQWGLVVNTDKTMVMIFNKGGRLINELFTYKTTSLQTVDTVVYLGMVFVPSGVFVAAQSRNAQKASKALYMIKKGLLRNRDYAIMPKTALKLFDAYIKPILLYNCAIWAPTSLRNRTNNDHHNLNLVNLDITEKVHTGLCKYLLGVSERTSNLASRAELGRAPMAVDIKISIIKYWNRLKSFPDNNIMKQAYLENEQLCLNSEKHVWASCVRATLESNGYGHAWYNDFQEPVNITAFKNVLTDQLRQRVHSDMFNDNVKNGTASKLRTYRLYKNGANFEDYLESVSNFKHRKALSKLRLSDHKLQIEVGRHTKTPLEERTCKMCSSDMVEDEVHFLCNCNLYVELRDTLYDSIGSAIANFNTMPQDSQLKVILQPSGRVAVLVAKFVYEGFNLRRLFL